MGGLNVEILVRHLVEQVADVVDDGVQARHHLRRGAGQLRGLILPAGLGDRRLQIALHQQLHPSGTGLHGDADIAGELQGHRDGGQNRGHDHQHVDEDANICIGQIVLLHGGDGDAPAVGAAHGGVGREPGTLRVGKAAKVVLPLAHL